MCVHDFEYRRTVRSRLRGLGDNPSGSHFSPTLKSAETGWHFGRLGSFRTDCVGRQAPFGRAWCAVARPG